MEPPLGPRTSCPLRAAGPLSQVLFLWRIVTIVQSENVPEFPPHPAERASGPQRTGCPRTQWGLHIRLRPVDCSNNLGGSVFSPLHASHYTDLVL
jgi:hypothetical protein